MQYYKSIKRLPHNEGFFLFIFLFHFPIPFGQVFYKTRGRIQDFQIEGAQKILCIIAWSSHPEREIAYGRGPALRAHVRALEALGFYRCSLTLSETYFEVFW